MIALLDVGNTRLKWGLADAGGWRERGAVARGDAVAWATTFAGRCSDVSRVWAVSVADTAADAELVTALGAAGQRLQWLRSGAAAQCGVRNGYARPAQLGADRWAALIGAWAVMGESALVVVAGTATTIDVLRAGEGEGEGEGVFDGGVIVPGLDLMRASLATGTARLPRARGQFAALPRSTDDAITTGCLEAQIGAIERMRGRLGSAAPVIVSGGAAPLLAPLIPPPVRQIDDLVLEGLRIVALY